MTREALFQSVIASLPEIIVIVGACLLLILGELARRDGRVKDWLLASASIAIVVAAALATIALGGEAREAYAGMFIADRFAAFFKVVFYLATILTFLLSRKYAEIEGIETSEYYVLLLFALCGMMIMASATDFLSLYVGLELMALSTYVLTGFTRRERRSNEAALKYVILGAVSTGILLYGISLVYGITGTTQFEAMAAAVAGEPLDPALLLAVVFIVAGLVFKVGAVPFHMWVPDVYEGAPTTITAFMSVGPKAAGFAAILRVFLNPLVEASDAWIIVAIIAVATMALGSFVALVQDNIKRLLAYSSIAHAGFALFGVVAGGADGIAGVMLYLLIYAFMNLGIFATVIMMRTRNFSGEAIEDYAGFAKTHPGLRASHAALPVLACRHPADGGVLRQVLRPRRPDRTRLRRACGDRRAFERRRRLFLHPHRDGDLHARAAARLRAGADAVRPRHACPDGRRDNRDRPVSGVVSQSCPAIRVRRLRAPGSSAGSARGSTSSAASRRGVDGRVKPGHDEGTPVRVPE